jgi:hypothetical protein
MARACTVAVLNFEARRASAILKLQLFAFAGPSDMCCRPGWMAGTFEI